MSSPGSSEDPSPSTSSFFDFEGKILRKKNISAGHLKLAIQEDSKERSTTVYIPRNEPVCSPSEFNFLYLGATIHVRGHINARSYHHVSQCNLVQCSPNVKMIKEILALPNYASFAPIMGMMEEEELASLVEEHSQKIVVNSIIEKITGKRAKAPPRYRPGRVKQSDMNILECKEAEGSTIDDGANGSNGWMLCQPCHQPTQTNVPVSFDRKKESIVNLPHGADDTISAHGKLTRSEYLETKKNNQAIWFVERIKQFDRQPRRFLDVGGGRGDLAVQIALHFPEATVVVVDSNESSILAGKDYAAKCGVEQRIEFCCMNFTDFVEEHDAVGCNGSYGDVDFVLALHACGDLSDMALSFASSKGCNFIICPCCYPKRYLAPFVPHWHQFCTKVEVDSLSRLVELDDHREVSRRAMLVVNSMRKTAFEAQNVQLEEFDNKISKRNIALVGMS